MEYPIYIKNNKYRYHMILNENELCRVENFTSNKGIDWTHNHFMVETQLLELEAEENQLATESEYLKFYKETFNLINEKTFEVENESPR